MKTHVSPCRCGCLLALALSLQPVLVGAADMTIPLLAPDSGMPLGVAVDTEDLEWLTYGEALWFGQTNVTSDGLDAAAVSLTDCAGAVLETSFTGPGVLSYRWKMVDPPTGQGTVGFSLLLGSTIIRAGSWPAFNTNWNQVFIDDLPAGPLTFRWSFSGPCYSGTGTSFGYLDQIHIATPSHYTVPAFSLQPETQSAHPNECATFRANAVASPTATYQWLRNGQPIADATNSTLILTSIAKADFADYGVVAANEIGAVTSVVARLTEPARPLALALDTPGRVWSTATGCEGDGAGRWLPEFSTTHDGIDSAVGRGLGCGPAALLETTVEGPGTVSFWWKTYTTESYFEDQDSRFFILDTNGGWEVFTYLPGNADWTQTSLSFGPGRKILRWEAHGYCNGHDEWTTTWLDQVVITPGSTAADAGCAGSVDPTFGNVRIEGDGYYRPNRISTLIPQADGKVVIAGLFSRVQGNLRPGLARLNSNGTLDPAFPRLAEESIVNAIAVDADGRLIVGGCMGGLNGLSISNLVRLHPDGQLDTTFQATVALLSVNAIALLPDGKILISAYSGSNDDYPPFTLLRLHPNGARDDTFRFTAAGWEPIYGLARQDDGSIIFNFTNRCDANGTVDESFRPEVSNLEITAVQALPDGRLLMGGRKPNSESTVLRLNRDGTRDQTFVAPSFCADISYGGSTEVLSLLPIPGGKTVVSGRFGFTDRTWNPLLVILHEDGSVDPLFQSETPYCAGCDDPEFVARTALTPGGDQLMIAGTFTEWNGLARANVARLHLGTGACNGVVVMATNEVLVMENSAIAQVTILRRGNTNQHVAISYTTMDDSRWWQPTYAFSPAFPGRDYVPQTGTVEFLPGETRRTVAIPLLDNLQLQANRLFLVKLHANTGGGLGNPETTRVVIVDDENNGNPGSLDLSFRPEIVSAPNLVAAVDQQGRIVVAEGGSYVNNGACTIRRLHTSGARDATFKPVAVNGFVHALATDASNRVLVAGTFTQVDTVSRAGIVRLSENGGIDPVFYAEPNGPVSKTLVLNGGKILISGHFTSVNGMPRASLARLFDDGKIDSTFDPGTGPAPVSSYDSVGSIYGLAEQADEKVLICGTFRSFNGVPRSSIVRLNQDGTVDESFSVATGQSDTIEGVTVLADQKILLSGWMFNGRFNPDGTRDVDFNPQAGETINTLIPTGGGKVIVNGHLRLNSDGSLDRSFFAGTAFGYSYCAPPLHLPDGRLVLYGGFQQFNEVSYPGLVILRGGLLPEGAGRIRFATAEMWATETDGVVDIAVHRDLGTVGTATAAFTTVDESAYAGVDYVAQSGAVVFTNNGAGEQVIQISLVNNSVAAGARRFRVNLTSPTGGAIVGVPSSILINIADDDVGVTLATNQLWQSESYNAGITMTRLGPSGVAFDVHVRVRGGTATDGIDFAGMETNVAFSATDTARWLNIPIFQDSTTEADESILIELSAVSDGVLLGIASATLWIGDDDRPPCIMAARLSQGGFDFTMDLPMMQSLFLEASTNLVDWEAVTYMYRGSIEGPLHFQDTGATNQAMRFYRFTQP